MTHEPSEHGGKLILQVTDSGKGFVIPASQKQLGTISNYHGRGIRLIETLCQRLEFLPPGNSVIVEFDWKWL
jgi:anti-sigma regulatory factor (Ser/Thr protein kinase)